MYSLCRKEGRKTKQYFEYSDNPFYNITRYTRTKEGKSKFVREEVPVSAPGGIFNLEFNSDGKILAAACEKKNILIFDPLRREVVHSINEAHTDCVNCIRYLIFTHMSSKGFHVYSFYSLGFSTQEHLPPALMIQVSSFGM